MVKEASISVLTNLDNFTDPESVPIIMSQKLPERLTLFSALKYHFQSYRCNYVLLNGVDNFFYLSLIRCILPFNKSKIIVLDLFLNYPRTFKDKLLLWLKRILLKHIYLAIVYFKRFDEYERIYGIDRRKFRHIPFKVNAFDKIKAAETRYCDYIFSGGRSRRDFGTLVEAVSELPYKVMVVSPERKERILHGTLFETNKCPPNVKIVHDDGSVGSFIEFIANAKLVIIPLFRKDMAPTGISVLLMAMALKKCVIISKGLAVEGIVDSDSVMIVPPENKQALKESIESLFNNDMMRKKIEDNAYKFAVRLGDDIRQIKSVREIIIDDARVRNRNKICDKRTCTLNENDTN